MNVPEAERLLEHLGWRRQSQDPNLWEYNVYEITVSGSYRLDVSRLESIKSEVQLADILIGCLHRLEGSIQGLIRSKVDIIMLELKEKK